MSLQAGMTFALAALALLIVLKVTKWGFLNLRNKWHAHKEARILANRDRANNPSVSYVNSIGNTIGDTVTFVGAGLVSVTSGILNTIYSIGSFVTSPIRSLFSHKKPQPKVDVVLDRSNATGSDFSAEVSIQPPAAFVGFEIQNSRPIENVESLKSISQHVTPEYPKITTAQSVFEPPPYAAELEVTVAGKEKQKKGFLGLPSAFKKAGKSSTSENSPSKTFLSSFRGHKRTPSKDLSSPETSPNSPKIGTPPRSASPSVRYSNQ